MISHPLVLVPAHLQDELSALARAEVPAATLRPYAPDGPLPPELPDAGAVVRWMNRRFSEMVEHGPNVTWLHTDSAGVDHVLTPAVRAKPNLSVTNSGSAFAPAISEFVLAWMLSVTHRLPELRKQQAAHVWHSLKQPELGEQTVGIVGLGPIGRAIAAHGKALGMTTLGFRRRSEAVPHIDHVLTGEAGLADLLAQSDWVVLAAALTDGTRALLGAQQFARMKRGAWLVNIARGALVDEAALLSALDSGQVGGACLDVFAQEPLPPESPFWDRENVYIAPHNSSGWSDGLHRRQVRLFLDNLARWTREEPLQSVVDIARGY